METIKNCESLSMFILNNVNGPFCCIMQWEVRKTKFYVNSDMNMFMIGESE